MTATVPGPAAARHPPAGVRRRIADLPVAVRVFGLVATGVVLCLAVGVVGQWGMYGAVESANNAIDNGARPAIAITSLRASWEQLRRGVADIASSATFGDRLEAIHRVTALRQQIQAGIDTLTYPDGTEPAEEVAGVVRPNFVRAMDTWDKTLMPLAKKDPLSAGDRATFSAALTEDFFGASEATKLGLVRLSNLQGAAMQRSLQAAQSARRTAIWRIWIATVAGTLLLVICGILVVRTVTRPLHMVRHALRALAGGDLTATTRIDSRDEIGHMAADLAVTQQALLERNRELGAANQLKADLIGMLGHEINNPLAIVLGNLDVVLAEETLSPQDHDAIATVYRTTQRLTAIVDEVLALVSLDAGRLIATPSAVRVADHIQAVLSGTGTVGVAVECARDLIATVQPSHLDQILTNLVSNAAKYGGGVTAIIAHGPAGTSGEERPVFTLEVRDEGPGVPPEFRDRLFDRFARAEPTAGKVAGTGLGLYIVRELARANDGDIRYRPAPIRGSSFIVTLPPAATSNLNAPPRSLVSG